MQELTPETEAMWQSLASIAIADQKYRIAERCYAALCDVSKAKFLRSINEAADDASAKYGGDGYQHYTVQAQIALLDKQFKRAEVILLEQGKTDAAMEMYQELHRWDDAIRVAEAKNHPEAENIKNSYFQWLLETSQEDRAAAMRERERRFDEAIDLYIRAGYPARAARIAQSPTYRGLTPEKMEMIASALLKGRLFEKAGDFYERLASYDRALDAYKQGNCFRRAVELARQRYPREVVVLEERWGEFLASQNQVTSFILV